ncbi:MAG: HlyD family efflux transporter periplasmic adaptor subunit [Muribaculaceae bacterium]|nr:HlyD family efflux transporter periplasmic adaptor subunit [Muribaculaceae bacterium]
MDRVLPQKQRVKLLIRRYLPTICIILLIVGGIVWGLTWLGGAVKETDLELRTAEIGVINSAVTTNGKIVPAFEEILVSPVNTRILEVYVHEGDSVEAGIPLLRLDLEEARNTYQRMADELAMKRSEINSQALSDETLLTDLEMRIRTKELALDRLKAEYESEVRLDSIGSGTGERVKGAYLAMQTASLELQQMKRQLDNERRIRKAMAESKHLEGNISERNLAEAARTLDEARLRSPKSGTVTFLASNIGAPVSAGEKIAVLADLTTFKVTGEMPEGQGDKLCVGAPVEVRSGKHIYTGYISHMTSQSKSGVIPFVVRLDSAGAPGLRAGMTARISVLYDMKPDVLRIPNGSFFNGPGDYDLYVRTSPTDLELRRIRLGDSNLDYIEVISGLRPGETINISPLRTTAPKLRIKLP